MKKFTVSIKEINYGATIVEAESEEKAEELAMEVYYNGDIHWTDSEIDEITVDEDEEEN
jgi:hypothetical protein